MDKLVDLMLLADLQGRMGDWFSGSLLHAWLPSGAAPVAWEPSTPREPSRKTVAKVGDYKRWIASGKAQRLTDRKSKSTPVVAVTDCDHPQEHLRGAGNGHSRDVFCSRCSARWNANGMDEYLAQVRLEEDAAMTGSASSGTPNCLCGSPAVRLVTKKPGPTQGRHFWKCAARVCQFFEWDQAEVSKLQGEKRKEMSDQKEHIERLQAQLQANQENYEITIQAQRAQFQLALGQLQQHAAANAVAHRPA